MRTENERESSNVEDRRGMSKGTLAAGGGIGAIILAIVVMLRGGDPSQLLNNQSAPGAGGGEHGRCVHDAAVKGRAVTVVA